MYLFPYLCIGYVYVTFENEKSVRSLLTMCRFDPSEGGQWYHHVSSKRMRDKEVRTDTHVETSPSL